MQIEGMRKHAIQHYFTRIIHTFTMQKLKNENFSS